MLWHAVQVTVRPESGQTALPRGRKPLRSAPFLPILGQRDSVRNVAGDSTLTASVWPLTAPANGEHLEMRSADRFAPPASEEPSARIIRLHAGRGRRRERGRPV